MTHLESHVARVEKWAEERGLYDTDSPLVQFGKMVEEVGELIMAIGKDDHSEIKDAIGDIRVCLISVCAIGGVQFRCSVNRNTYEDINTWINELMVDATDLLSECIGGRVGPGTVQAINIDLSVIATHYNFTLEECDDAAWEQIKNRTGKTISGEFVKDEE